MTPSLQGLLAELEAFGQDNDRSMTERPRRMLNITRDTGEFLAVLVRGCHARRVLEIGTSNGYSTLWLAWAVQAIDGRVTTLEYSAYKGELAQANVARAGMAEWIDAVQGEAGAYLAAQADAAFDFIFLDAERSEYPGWWPHIRRVLRPGGMLVVDNALSHAEELAPFVVQVAADGGFTACTVPVGNGEFMATRSIKL